MCVNTTVCQRLPVLDSHRKDPPRPSRNEHFKVNTITGPCVGRPPSHYPMVLVGVPRMVRNQRITDNRPPETTNETPGESSTDSQKYYIVDRRRFRSLDSVFLLGVSVFDPTKITVLKSSLYDNEGVVE